MATAPLDRSPDLGADDVAALNRLRGVYGRLRQELARVIIGQEETIERLTICLFARGHALLMGVPGLAKTLLVSKLAECVSLKFSRIQFTPDLMPMDITGTDILQETADGRREFCLHHGSSESYSHFPRKERIRASLSLIDLLVSCPVLVSWLFVTSQTVLCILLSHKRSSTTLSRASENIGAQMMLACK